MGTGTGAQTGFCTHHTGSKSAGDTAQAGALHSLQASKQMNALRRAAKPGFMRSADTGTQASNKSTRGHDPLAFLRSPHK
jgi:hypothetical protein